MQLLERVKGSERQEFFWFQANVQISGLKEKQKLAFVQYIECAKAQEMTAEELDY